MSTINPNSALAEQIAKKLIEDGLMDSSSKAAFVQGMSKGIYKESDWKTLLEEVINKPKPDSDETSKTSD